MELEVGMYVRTKDGTIGKIIAIDLAKPRQEKYPNHPSKRWWRDKILISCYKGWITTQNIIKASYNIIDLIKVGDYVNGEKVLETNCKWEYMDDDSDTGVNEVYDGLELQKGRIYFEYEIETVVTKEQMEQMAYKVVE